MKSKRYYYQFWLRSSRGTDAAKMYMYTSKPTKEQLKDDLERWCEGQCAWQVSENVCSYGWRPVVPPKNRKACLAKYQRACKMKAKWFEQSRLYAGLLQFL